MGRDPIEEEGGVNLYGFVGNEPIGRWDMLGQAFGYITKDEPLSTVWGGKPTFFAWKIEWIVPSAGFIEQYVMIDVEGVKYPDGESIDFTNEIENYPLYEYWQVGAAADVIIPAQSSGQSATDRWAFTFKSDKEKFECSYGSLTISASMTFYGNQVLPEGASPLPAGVTGDLPSSNTPLPGLGGAIKTLSYRSLTLSWDNRDKKLEDSEVTLEYRKFFDVVN